MAEDVKNISEELYQQGKEYSLGSARFFRSKEKSFECFYKSHSMGNIKGTFGLALAYFEGNGVAIDRTIANQLVMEIITQVENHSNQGIVEFLVILGDMYSFGLGKPVDFEMAFSLYYQAAQKGSLEAQCDLGYCYLVGQGVSEDIDQTISWWEKSAKAGYAHSCRDIGECYFDGNGVEQDYKKAMHWFQKASEQNYSHGTGDLAYCYLFGLGIQKDILKAKGLYQLALRQDYDRTIRDLMSANIQIDRFLTDGEIAFCEVKPIEIMSNEDFPNGKLYVNSLIDRINPKAFYFCDKLNKFIVDAKNHQYCSIDGVLYSKDKKVLIRYPNGRDSDEFIVPSQVTRIGSFAFQNARKLRRVVLNESVQEIEDSAFDDCKNLISINIPLSTVKIGAWAFHACDKLQTICLPAGLNYIGLYAFGSCESLTALSVGENNDLYSSMDGCLYNRDKTVLIQYPIGKNDKGFVVPTEVQTIDFRAFSDAFYLEEVIISQNTIELLVRSFFS